MTAKLDRLLEIMARLRDPDTGCPWDVVQTFRTIAPYTIEEAYEVADAIERDDMAGLRDELGDLLLQVVFHARMAEEVGAFAFDDVAAAVSAKLVRRHPHVFGDDAAATPDAVRQSWEGLKADERRARAEDNGDHASVLDDLPRALPALMRAEKMQRRVARVGFDWPSVEPIFAKLDEEIGELQGEIANGGDAGRLADELGDLLFVCVNLARRLGVDPETALRGTNDKVERRFRTMESRLADANRAPEDLSLDELEALWQAAKQAERQPA